MGLHGDLRQVNGGGFLTDHYPDSYKAIWDFRGQEVTSRHIPGVRYTGITHPGCSAPRRRPICWPSGTGASRR